MILSNIANYLFQVSTYLYQEFIKFGFLILVNGREDKSERRLTTFSLKMKQTSILAKSI